MQRYGIPVPRFGVARTKAEAEAVVRKLGLTRGVVKIQVHAGGRGKAGGVKFGKTPEEIIALAAQLIGMKLVNAQTGPAGVIAHHVLISEPIDIAREYYLGAIIDRSKAQPILIASPEGGVEIEEVAEKHPEKILRCPIGLDGKVRPYHLLDLVKFMGWTGEAAKQGKEIAANLARMFLETDASLLEVNPLAQDPSGKLWALDGKLAVDDNALYRQPEIAAFYDPTQVSPNEVEAKKHDLAYIALDGNIGCMVNGAGLAMATMDLIQYAGGRPANFLDVGGSATVEKVAEGLKILLADAEVKAILINIFGGIMNCQTIAEGILAVQKARKIGIPLVVRMEGTNFEEAKKMLAASGLPITFAAELKDAAETIVEVLRGDSHR
jgi:succinyl-CoA synthetase beta subunit